jgi:site-specific recombinase XerD
MPLELIYHCGLRLTEAMHIEVTDIDAKMGRIHVRTTKGGQDRYVPVSPAMVEKLRKFWARHRNPKWLFPGLTRGWNPLVDPIKKARESLLPVRDAALQIAFRQACNESGVKKHAVIHSLRHSYATHMLEEGIALRLISLYLGHATLETTLIYTHLSEVSEEKTREVLNRLHFNINPK